MLIGNYWGGGKKKEIEYSLIVLLKCLGTTFLFYFTFLERLYGAAMFFSFGGGEYA